MQAERRIAKKINGNRRKGAANLNSAEFFGTVSAFERSYRILRELGSGGEGKVYLVRHIVTEQLRAAKRLEKGKGDDRLHELNMMKKLEHPSLPRVIDVLEDEAYVWLVLEYIRGNTLHEIYKEGMNAEQFFFVFRQLSEVLLYLHSRSVPILHLDIKPSNILQKKDGTVMLIDFGAAVRSREGVVLEKCYGTPGFAAPEQYRKGEQLDERTDIYGFGAVMKDCVFGKEGLESVSESGKFRNERKMVPGRKAGVWENSESGEREKWNRIRKTGSRRKRLSWWQREALKMIRKCMEPDRRQRYQSSRALWAALGELEKRYMRRKKLVQAAGAGGLLLFLCTFAVSDMVSEYHRQVSGQEETYEMLLSQAETLGFVPACNAYEAALRQRPGEDTVFFRLISRIRRDYLFTSEEEKALKTLLYLVLPGKDQTVEEQLARTDGRYGELAYEIGITYWYFYEEMGGKAAAAGWFEKAVSWAESEEKEERGEKKSDGAKLAEEKNEGRRETADVEGRNMEEKETEKGWEASARIHGRIARYYETLGRADENGVVQAEQWQLWCDLKELWQLDSFQRESFGIRRQVVQEMLSCIIMESGDLQRRGEQEEELEKLLEEFEAFAEAEEVIEESSTGEGGFKKEAEKLKQQCQDARTALKRIFEE